mgnify:CR=1 FL=1
MFSFINNIFKKKSTFDTAWPLRGRKVGERVELPNISCTQYSVSSSNIEPTQLTSILDTLNLPCSVRGLSTGPVTTTFTLDPINGTRIGLLPTRAIDIAVRLGVESVQIDGNRLTISNPNRAFVNFTDCIHDLYNNILASPLPYIVGSDTNGKIRIGDLTQAPHTLIAGSTGAGKSVFVNNIIASILATRDPTHVRFVMIDPKRVEYAQYQNLSHLLHPVIDEIPVAINILKGLCEIMEDRYKFLSKAGFQSVEQWNSVKCPSLSGMTAQQLHDRIYPIVVFIDEYADLVMQDKNAAALVTRLGQKARAAGIHLVLCTQHPLAKIISTAITTNFPTRVAFQVQTASASRVILDTGGAENLLRKGDMIYQDATESFRAQGPFVTPELTNHLVNHWRR